MADTQMNSPDSETTSAVANGASDAHSHIPSSAASLYRSNRSGERTKGQSIKSQQCDGSLKDRGQNASGAGGAGWLGCRTCCRRRQVVGVRSADGHAWGGVTRSPLPIFEDATTSSVDQGQLFHWLLLCGLHPVHLVVRFRYQCQVRRHDLGEKGARASACAVAKQTCSLSVPSQLGEAPRMEWNGFSWRSQGYDQAD